MRRSSFDADRLLIKYEHDQSIKVVSFDVFDTLVFRDVAKPTDVFVVVERLLDGISDFARVRERVRHRDKINSIYDEVQRITGCSDEVRNRYMNCEIECEISLSTVNLEMVKILNRFKEAGKKIILTSDMYLPKEVIREIMHHAGLTEDQYDELYISCEKGLTKKSGELFRFVLKREEIRREELLHIGDALRSDYLVPRMIGCKSELYYRYGFMGTISIAGSNMFEKALQKCGHAGIISASRFERKTLDALISNHTQASDYYDAFGYRCLGSLVYGFTLWLNEQIKYSEYKDTVYFLAREGKIFKDAYEVIGGKNPTQYVLVSRRSIIASLLWKCESVEEMLRSLSVKRTVNMKTICSLMGIDDDTIAGLENRQYKNINELLSASDSLSIIKSYENKIREKSKEQYRLMTSYFDAIGLNNPGSTVIVDIGWQGTMQSWLQKYWESIGVKKSVLGLYMGVKKNFAADNKKGWLFDKGIGISESSVFGFGGLLESMLSETEGSVKEYVEERDRVEVIRSHYEYEKIKPIRRIQEGVQKFIYSIQDSILSSALTLDKTESSVRSLKFGNKPSTEDIKMIGGLKFVDDSYENQMMDDRKNENQSSIIKQIMNSNWKVGEIKKVFWWMPAHSIYFLLYTIRDYFEK